MDMLTVMNRALVATGNNPVTLNEGTPEWIVVATGWPRCTEFLVTQSKWPFGKKSTALVLSDGDESEIYDYGHRLPTEAISVLSVWYNGALVTDFEVIGRDVYTLYNSGITVEYSVMPEDSAWHPQVVEVLTLMLEKLCYSGLNEDLQAAAAKENEVQYFLSQARSIVSAQNPGKNLYRREIREIRAARRG